jgi:predicted patatin/cPLA2 family phospholipase
LKKQLLEREQSHGDEIFNLNEKIQSLQADLADIRKANSDLLDEQGKRSLMQSREDHSNCVAVEKHKAKLNEILGLSKEATQKEMAVKLENIKLKNINA